MNQSKLSSDKHAEPSTMANFFWIALSGISCVIDKSFFFKPASVWFDVSIIAAFAANAFIKL